MATKIKTNLKRAWTDLCAFVRDPKTQQEVLGRVGEAYRAAGRDPSDALTDGAKLVEKGAAALRAKAPDLCTFAGTMLTGGTFQDALMASVGMSWARRPDFRSDVRKAFKRRFGGERVEKKRRRKAKKKE